MVPTSAMPAPQRRAFAIRMGVSMRRAASLGSCRSARLPGTRRFRGPAPARLSRVPLMVAFGDIGRCLLFGAPMRPWPSGAALRCRWRGLPPRIACCRRSARAPASRERACPSWRLPSSLEGRVPRRRFPRVVSSKVPGRTPWVLARSPPSRLVRERGVGRCARPSLMSPMSVLGRQEASRAERLGGVEAPDGPVPSEGWLPARSPPALNAP